jgi:hypothetical protein
MCADTGIEGYVHSFDDTSRGTNRLMAQVKGRRHP